MRDPQVKALALPAVLSRAQLRAGNCIAISWSPELTADVADVTDVVVVRRTSSYPERHDPRRPSEGVVVVDRSATVTPDDWTQVVDEQLVDGTTYYYRVFALGADGGVRDTGAQPALASATATGPYEFGERMYRLLPELYRRFDTAGELRRFLELVGGQLDQTYSAVRGIPELVDVASVDGRLLPLLAGWIGWGLDHSRGLDHQRAELRGAIPLYQGTQTVAVAQATVTRIARWDAIPKEFADNVATTNRPERHTIWLHPAAAAAGDEPISSDESAAERVAIDAGTDVDSDVVTLLYATRSNVSELREKRIARGVAGPSAVVVSRGRIEAQPAVARRRDTVWLFWASRTPDTGWRIDFRTRTDGGTWSDITPFVTGPGDTVQRKSPAVLMDDADRLWMFWRERGDHGWVLKYRRYAADVTPAPTGATAFPRDGDEDPRVDGDVAVTLTGRGGPGPRIWVVWARRELPDAQGAALRSWRVASRFKAGTGEPADDWSPIVELDGQPGAHDREPFPFAASDGTLTAYFGSTRDGSWSVWSAAMDPTTHVWGAPDALTEPPYSDRTPAVFDNAGVTVVYRSARPIRYPSARISTAATSDVRYCGSTTLRTANASLLGRMGTDDDVAAYTPYAGDPAARTDADLIAGDTLGLYVKTAGVGDTEGQQLRRRLNDVLHEFLPATTRAVVIPMTNG